MQNNPLVSLYVPCLNGERYLERCLKSILAQDYDNLEIIVIDNGSLDDSVKIVEKYMATSDNIRLYHCKTKGLAAVRNMALCVCRGEWITCADCDDELLPGYVSLMVKTALYSKADMVVSGFFFCRDSQTKAHSYEKAVIKNKEEIHKFFLTKGLNNNHCWGKLIRRGVFEGVSYPEGCVYEDLAVLPKTLENIECMAVMQECLYKYYATSGSISGRGLSKEQLQGIEFRKENALFYEENYPKLSGYAYDAVLHFGFFLLGKHECNGDTELITDDAGNLTGTVREYIEEAAAKAAIESFSLKVAYLTYKISYKLAGKIFYIYSKKHK